MTWVVVLLLVPVLWMLWDIRRALGLLGHPGHTFFPKPQPPASHRPEFRGAIPPNRYVVVRWPQGWLEYQGCVGAQARTTYEHTHPAPGEEIEFWELGDRRGHKG